MQITTCNSVDPTAVVERSNLEELNAIYASGDLLLDHFTTSSPDVPQVPHHWLVLVSGVET